MGASVRAGPYRRRCRWRHAQKLYSARSELDRNGIRPASCGLARISNGRQSTRGVNVGCYRGSGRRQEKEGEEGDR